MTWGQRAQEALLGAVVFGGLAFFGGLQAGMDPMPLAGLAGSTAFSVFANSMGLGPQMANWRNRERQ